MKRVLVLVFIMSLLGCFYRTYDYYYASLENLDDARVITRKKLSVKDLTGNSIIPIEYTMDRQEYSLNFLIGDKIRRAHFKISVHGSGDTELGMKPKIDMTLSSKNGISCARYYLDDNNPTTMQFEWDSNCFDKDIRKAMLFDIVDVSGNVIASEHIPFVLVRDGKFRQIDAF